jgi:hypothetical protein
MNVEDAGEPCAIQIARDAARVAALAACHWRRDSRAMADREALLRAGALGPPVEPEDGCGRELEAFTPSVAFIARMPF